MNIQERLAKLRSVGYVPIGGVADCNRHPLYLYNKLNSRMVGLNVSGKYKRIRPSKRLKVMEEL